MASDHFCLKCAECNVVISQCRCPDPGKITTYSLCDKCRQTKIDRLEDAHSIQSLPTENKVESFADILKRMEIKLDVIGETDVTDYKAKWKDRLIMLMKSREKP